MFENTIVSYDEMGGAHVSSFGELDTEKAEVINLRFEKIAARLGSESVGHELTSETAEPVPEITSSDRSAREINMSNRLISRSLASHPARSPKSKR
ncbi:MAG: hypothetical protein ACREGA_01615 [Candidatus Saccharimonadales bacterium]